MSTRVQLNKVNSISQCEQTMSLSELRTRNKSRIGAVQSRLQFFLFLHFVLHASFF